ncbi:FtsW/RodA/SpoVE family cell cycle protein [Vampirovibrio chlorellavorus]|uniref:FtsW/RodA/SpoVE family cell cycle protein n=1 Tax=Vampirovibrio chlorellavorus TaxID=758823 RepID=UPI0026EA3858|nr:putative peptidoglycan glycosyltransferase FtsW [Vampirovibrio chlorellavorus]
MSRAYAQAASRSVNPTRYRTGGDFGPGERFGDGVGNGARAGAFDQTLMYTTVALVVVGLVSVFTASAAQADLETGNSLTLLFKQLISAVIGAGALVFFIGFPFERLKRLARPFSLVCVGLLLMTMFMGTTANGSERWIMLPFGFQFQPSDFAKVGAIALMAQATSERSIWSMGSWLNLLMVGMMIVLILQQPNLSVTMILGILTFAMMFVAGLSRSIVLGTLPFIVFLAYQKIRHTEYQWKRIVGWLDPWKDAQDAGYNLIQSYYAIGSGGLFGVGLGNSIQKLYYLPFQHTDFIFSVICEEWGFFGALIVMGLFALLGWRGFTIAWHCPSRFGKMLAFGLTLAIVLQAMINISVTIGLMPVTGVTLPLISYGGTSMIVTLAMIGMLLNISRTHPLPQPQEEF